MEYMINSHLNSTSDVKDFFHHLVYEKHCSFHPDDPIVAEMIKGEDECTITEEMAKEYNRLMGEAFDICQNEGVDIYGIGYEELYGFLKESRLK